MKKLKSMIIVPVITVGMILSVITGSVFTGADQTVYTTATGTKYHFSSGCRGLNNARTLYTQSLSSALAEGYSPCSICADGVSETPYRQSIQKYDNPIQVTGKKAIVKYAAVKKNTQKLNVHKVLDISNAKGQLFFAKKAGNSKITINKYTGKVKVKKGLKKGTYKIKVKVLATGDDIYEAKLVSAIFKIRVK